MKMRRLALWFGIVTAIGFALAASGLPPHVVFIIAGTVGFMGGWFVEV